MVWATCEQWGKELGRRQWAVAAVSGRAFDAAGKWATVGVLGDNFVLLFLTYTAPIFHYVML